MYGGLADGMQRSAVQNGQGGLFDNANAVTTTGHAFMENVGSKIAKANNPLQETVTPDRATSNILNSDDTTMQAVRQELPDAADVLAAYKLRQAQTAKPSVASSHDDTSTGTFLSNMNRMRQTTPGGYAALYNTPAVQQQVGDLQTVAGALRDTQRHLNTSGTAEQLGWYDYTKGIAEAVGAAMKNPKEWLGVPGAVLGPPTVGWGTGSVLTSPEADPLCGGAWCRGAGLGAARGRPVGRWLERHPDHHGAPARALARLGSVEDQGVITEPEHQRQIQARFENAAAEDQQRTAVRSGRSTPRRRTATSPGRRKCSRTGGRSRTATAAMRDALRRIAWR